MKIETNQSSQNLVKLSVTQGLSGGIAVALPVANTLSTLDTLQAPQETLPPIEVVKRGNYTYYRNAFGVQITTVKYPKGSYSYMLSNEGLAVMLRQHDGKRDTLNFSDMNPNIPKSSQIPNVFFHVKGDGVSQLTFNDKHQPVATLANGEQLIFDRDEGQTPMSGPFSIAFFPDQAGQNFDVSYTGQDQLKRFKSKGDTVRW